MPCFFPRRQTCDAAGRAFAGSQKQIQNYINEQPDTLNKAIEDALGCTLGLRWVSPLKADRYREYKDGPFLDRLGFGKNGQDLKMFWPRGGPRWDALACVETADGVLLPEAKSYVSEMYISGCGATDPASLRIIDGSLASTKAWLGVPSTIDWRGTFDYHVREVIRKGFLYQMANRLAHLYFFREVVGIDAWFVNVCFTDDPHSPTSREEWEAGLAEAISNLGVSAVPFAADVILPALK